MRGNKSRRPIPRTRVGLEHEYIVRRDGEQIDFRSVIHELDVPGRRLDPADLHAYRLPIGAALTCDGHEAEVATPPVDVATGFVLTLRRWAAAAAGTLTELTASEFEIEGVSTHISVSVRDELANEAAGMFCRTFAPALMVLMDARDSPGLLVRPRHERVELGGEFSTGKALEACVALAVGGVLVCEGVAAGELRKSRLPPPIAVDVVGAVLRYGWYVDRSAFGLDLYQANLTTKLFRERRGNIELQRMLDASWQSARLALEPLVATEDLAAADAIVAGSEPLPLDSSRSRQPEASQGEAKSALGEVVRPVRSQQVELRAVAATWDFTVFETQTEPALFVSVPAAETAEFLRGVEAGAWDGRLARALDSPTGDERLASYDQACSLAVYGDIGPLSGLAAPERGSDGVPRSP